LVIFKFKGSNVFNPIKILIKLKRIKFFNNRRDMPRFSNSEIKRESILNRQSCDTGTWLGCGNEIPKLYL
jgi:hypothetical protein